MSAKEKIEHVEKRPNCSRDIRKEEPASLPFRARINADTDFKNRHQTHSEECRARICESSHTFSLQTSGPFRSEIKKGKRPKTASKTCRTVNSNRDSRKAVYSAPRENIVTINNVHRIAETLQEKISQFSKIMSKLEGIHNKQVKKYKCLLSESHHKKGGIKKPLKTTSIKEMKRKAFKVKLPSKKTLSTQKNNTKSILVQAKL